MADLDSEDSNDSDLDDDDLKAIAEAKLYRLTYAIIDSTDVSPKTDSHLLIV